MTDRPGKTGKPVDQSTNARYRVTLDLNTRTPGFPWLWGQLSRQNKDNVNIVEDENLPGLIL